MLNNEKLHVHLLNFDQFYFDSNTARLIVPSYSAALFCKLILTGYHLVARNVKVTAHAYCNNHILS